MLKKIGIILLTIFVAIVVVRSYRINIGGLFSQNKQNKSQIQDEIMSYRLNSNNGTKQVQTALKKAGFYKDGIDGKMGPQTKKAIKAFQGSRGLNPDGVIGPRTWDELVKILNK